MSRIIVALDTSWHSEIFPDIVNEHMSHPEVKLPILALSPYQWIGRARMMMKAAAATAIVITISPFQPFHCDHYMIYCSNHNNYSPTPILPIWHHRHHTITPSPIVFTVPNPILTSCPIIWELVTWYRRAIITPKWRQPSTSVFFYGFRCGSVSLPANQRISNTD